MSAKYQVDNQELKDAIKTFTKLGRRKSAYVSETVVEFLVDKIEITFDGMTVEVKARGKGKGRARIKSGFMRYLNSGIKDQEDIKMWVEDNFFHVGTLALECDWNDISPGIIELSVDPPLGEVLLLSSQHTPEEIAASGFKTILDQAEEDYKDIVEKTTKILQPLHISSESLEDFIMNQLKSKYNAQ